VRVLLSTIGSRGDVQPLVALALELRALGAEARLCVPPDFREWIVSLGFHVTPIGPELRAFTAGPNAASAPPSAERLRALAEGTVTAQFETISTAADGCDIMVGATALQIAAPSIAEKVGIPYVFVAYCPRVLPSVHHAPIPLGMRGEVAAPETADIGALWADDARRWNATWGAMLNARRASSGLPTVDEVRRHVHTDHPWLAADAMLAPWPEPSGGAVFQTGAWLIADERPLSPELESFLDSGEPPVYLGFGSIRAPNDSSRVMIEATRAVGRRAIVSRGWTDLRPIDEQPDCFSIGEVNQQALFPRVAAVVHHGGAGTTTAAALAAAPQVVVPQMYDQHYWAGRVEQLGIGAAHQAGAPVADSLTSALERALAPHVAARARSVATTIRRDGAQIAARRLMSGGFGAERSG
jgi:vancomycin aglycone glucosyltransferase